MLGSHLLTPPDNIGPRSTPNYAALADAAVATLPGGIKTFAGQRDDPFFVDLGSIFDLAGLRPFNAFHLIPLRDRAGPRRRGSLQHPHDRDSGSHCAACCAARTRRIGIYASASRQQVRILRDDGTTDAHGRFVQVSRLGEPLINEVVIPLGAEGFLEYRRSRATMRSSRAFT